MSFSRILFPNNGVSYMFYNVRDILYLSFQLIFGDKELLARQVGYSGYFLIVYFRLPQTNQKKSNIKKKFISATIRTCQEI